MNELKLITDYKNNENYRLSFNKLAIQTYGIDFEPWFKKGFWNERYVTYSYIDGDQVVSNVSINKMDLIWEGQKKKALQIGTVMTHPDYKKKGLASSLMNAVLTEHEKDYDFIYLFANDSALSLYLKFGFEPMTESKFFVDLNDAKLIKTNLRKLNISDKDDLDLITKFSLNRNYISTKLGVTNDEALIMFYCLYVYTDNIYYIEEDNVITLFKTEGAVLHLYDVISKDSIILEKVIAKIASREVTQVIFHFTPDLEHLKVQSEDLQESDVTLLVRPLQKKLTSSFLFPATSHS